MGIVGRSPPGIYPLVRPILCPILTPSYNFPYRALISFEGVGARAVPRSYSVRGFADRVPVGIHDRYILPPLEENIVVSVCTIDGFSTVILHDRQRTQYMYFVYTIVNGLNRVYLF